MQKLICSIFVFGILFCIPKDKLSGQNFNAGIVLGFTAAQIDGDRLAGYDKLGITGGIKSIYALKDKMDLSLELLYSMRGSQSSLGLSGVPVQKVRLDYLELPIIYTYKDWYQPDEDFYRVHVSGGLSYGRLFNYEVNDFEFAFESGNGKLHRNDFAFLLDIAFFTTPNWAFSIRYNRSLNNLYKEIDINQGIHVRLKGYFLSFRILYIF